MTQLQGIAASPGIGIGPIHIVDPEEIEIQDGDLAPQGVAAEKERFRTAIQKSLEEVRELREKIALETGEEQARILDTQLEILEDPEAASQTLAAIERDRKPAAFAYRKILTAVAARLDEADNEYYRGRAIDVRDVRRRMLGHLGGVRAYSLRDLTQPSLIVASDLPPSEMALLPRNMALGFATDLGGRTSHTAIMARARGIPAVVGAKGATDSALQGAIAIVDGTRGIAIFDPDPETLAEHERKRDRYRELAATLTQLKDQPCTTADGRVLQLGANLEVPEELPSVLENGADGIGLYRTEFFYLTRKQLPTEEAQFNAYRSIVEAMHPRPVNIRTLDVGGDKFASYLGTPIEKNPFLGMRGAPVQPPPRGDLPHAAARDLPRLGLRQRARDVPDGARARGPPPRARDRGARQAPAPEGGDRHGPPGAAGDHDRDPRLRVQHRSSRAGGRLRQHRDERPDPVHAGGGSRQRGDRRDLRAAPSRRAPGPEDGGGRGA